MYDEDTEQAERPVPSLNLNLPIETTGQFAHRLNWQIFTALLEVSFIASLWWAVLVDPRAWIIFGVSMVMGFFITAGLPKSS